MEKHRPRGPYEKFIKRPLDILGGVLSLLLLGWLLLLVAILVRVKLGAPVIFRQERPGKNGKIFRLYKFRTMTNAKDAEGNLLPDVQRLTKFGRILRATSLDELPEIINIIKGDMSFIGPRPLAVQYLPYYTEEERHRHDVRPGLSGWAQVHGRNSIRWEKKFEYDVWYSKNVTFLVDFKTFILTIVKVFKHDEIGQGEAIPESLHVERNHWILTERGAIAPGTDKTDA